MSDIDSVKIILDTFGSFKLCAGLIVNLDKTNGKFIGSLKYITDEPLNLNWGCKNISALGVTISGKETDHYNLNYKKRIVNLKTLLNCWKSRKLSLKGKVTVINTLAITPLLYIASVDSV